MEVEAVSSLTLRIHINEWPEVWESEVRRLCFEEIGWTHREVAVEKSLALAGKYSAVRLRGSRALVRHCIVPARLAVDWVAPIRELGHPSVDQIIHHSRDLAKVLGGLTICPRHLGRMSIRILMGSITLLYLYH